MSNHLAQIYSTTKNAEKYIVLNSQNVELSGNVKLTNGNLEVSNNLIFNSFSVGDKISFRENSNSTSYNIINDNLKSNNDASFNNVELSGNLNINGGLAIDNSFGSLGQILTSQGSSTQPLWTTPTGGSQVAYFQANTFHQAASGIETQLTFGNEIVSNAFVTASASVGGGTDFTINTAGTYKFESSVFVTATGSDLYYLQLDLNHTPFGGTAVRRSESIFDFRNGSYQEEMKNVTLSLFYVQANIGVGDIVDISIKPLYSTGILNISNPITRLDYQGSTKFLITKLA